MTRSDAAGRPVVDRTGLSGTYVLDFLIDSSAGFIVDSIQDQTGLRFDPKDLPMDIFTITHAERPDPN